MGRQFASSVRWLWAQPALRTLTLALCLMNVTLVAGFSVMVLYAREHLGLSEFGYGVLLTASAVGGLAGALVAPRLQARFSASLLLRVGLVLETLTHLGLALAGSRGSRARCSAGSACTARSGSASTGRWCSAPSRTGCAAGSTASSWPWRSAAPPSAP
nr:MFS transporter [Kitasatospora fiedleri]